jgi:aryl-alcohol dehydrogenase-like predicted oxidoreductase
MTFGAEADEATSRKLVDRFIDAGGNFFDTADVYSNGASEEFLGRALQHRRDSAFVATKFRLRSGGGVNDVGGSRRHLRLAVEASLRRLGTEWIDLYQMHAWDPATPLEETLSTLDDLVHEGKVRYLGVSNFAAWHLATADGVARRHGWERFVSLQPEYSLVCRGAENELLPFAQHAGLAVIPWSPLAGGVLTGKYRAGADTPADSRGGRPGPAADQLRTNLVGRNLAVVEGVCAVAQDLGATAAQVALAWVLGRPGITAPILGARTLDQLDDNLGALDVTLSDDHRARLDELSQHELVYPQTVLRMLRIG